jgi:hypothetical protein
MTLILTLFGVGLIGLGFFLSLVALGICFWILLVQRQA